MAKQTTSTPMLMKAVGIITETTLLNDLSVVFIFLLKIAFIWLLKENAHTTSGSFSYSATNYFYYDSLASS